MIRKALKSALYALGGLVLLLVAAGVAMSLLVNPNDYKPEIERRALEATGRTLRLEGDLGLAFFPTLGLRLGRTTLSERAAERTFASLDAATIAVALVPLLRREVVVDEVRLVGLQARIVRGKDGRLNIDDLAARPAAPVAAPAPPSAVPGPPVRIDISGVRIERASVSYRDERSGQELALEDLELRTGRIANDVPGTARLRAAVKGRNPALDVKIELSGEYRVDLANGAYAVDRLELQLNGNAAGVSGIALAVKGALAAQPDKGRFSARGLSLDAGARLGEDALEAKLSAPAIALEGETARGEALRADLKLAGPGRSVQARVTLSGTQGSARRLSIGEAKLELDARAGEAGVTGSLATPLRANFETQVYEAPALAGTLVASHPLLPQKSLSVPLQIALRADLAKESVAADIGAKLEESNLQAKLGMMKFAAPHYSFDINLDRLDVDRYFPPAKKDAGAQPPAAKPEAQADVPVDLSVLRGLSAAGRARVGELTVQRVKLTELSLPLRVANGRLEASPHAARLYGGSVSGALALDAEGNRVALREELRGVALGPLVRDLIERDLIEGRGEVALDVNAAGASVNALKRALAGNARLALKDGALKGINLGEALRKTKAAFGSKSAAQQAADRSEKTDFGDLTASFVIKNGVAHNEDLLARSPLFRLSGAGDIDIGNSSIEYALKAAVSGSAGAPGGDLSHVAGLTVPVRVSGPFDALKYEIQYREMVGETVKARIQEKLRGGEGAASPAEQVKDKVKERLRGLLKR